jgi:hypothetical protein
MKRDAHNIGLFFKAEAERRGIYRSKQKKYLLNTASIIVIIAFYLACAGVFR